MRKAMATEWLIENTLLLSKHLATPSVLTAAGPSTWVNTATIWADADNHATPLPWHAQKLKGYPILLRPKLEWTYTHSDSLHGDQYPWNYNYEFELQYVSVTAAGNLEYVTGSAMGSNYLGSSPWQFENPHVEVAAATGFFFRMRGTTGLTLTLNDPVDMLWRLYSEKEA